MQKLTDWRNGRLPRNAGWLKFGLILAMAGMMVSAAWAQPANDNFANATALSGNVGTVAGSNVGATLENCEPTFIEADDFAGVDNSVWYSWTATSSGSVEIDTYGSTFDTVLAVYTTPTALCDPGLTLVAANDDSTTAPVANPYASQLTFAALAGTTYYISVNGNASPATTDSGGYVLNWNAGTNGTAGLPNDNFTNATVLTGNSGKVTGSNVGATVQACEPPYITTDDFATVTKSVWYQWTPEFNGPAEFDTLGTGFDTVLAVYTDPDPDTLCNPALTLVAGNDNSPAVTSKASQVYFQAQAGTTYYIAVDGNAYPAPPFTNCGAFTLNWNSTNSGVSLVSTVPSGTFQLTANPYVYSERESAAPYVGDQTTVDDSLQGAQVTVTRTGGYNGRVLVGYQITPLTYTNVLITNTIISDYYLIAISSNGITTSYTNVFTPIYLNTYGYYEGGYQQYINAGTNNSLTNTGSVMSFLVPTITNVVVLNQITGAGPYPSNAPPLNLTTNTVFKDSTNMFTDSSTYTNTFATNTYESPTILTNVARANYTNSYSTNAFGSTTTLTYFTSGIATNIYSANGASYTNYFTNGIFSTIYVLNAVTYSNYYSLSNVVVSGEITNYSVISSNIIFAFGLAYNTVTNTDTMGTNSGTYTNIITAFSYTTTNTVTNIVLSATNSDFNPTTGVVALNDYQTFANILIPVQAEYNGPDGPLVPGLPRLVDIALTSVTLDPEESAALAAPTLAPGGNNSLISILSDNFVPGDSAPATNSILNFERATFRVQDDVAGSNAIVSVFRTGGSVDQSVSVNYVIDPANGPEPYYDPYNSFPLLAGSDYAVPNVDYVPVSGTLSWAAYDTTPKQITIPILNTGLVKPNLDMLLELWNYPPVANTDIGAVYQAHLTIIFNKTLGGPQPAGAVDRTWNPDNLSGNGFPGDDQPFLTYPGTSGGNGGQVYAVAEQPDGKAVIGGSFVSYDNDAYNNLVRVLSDGEHDATFMAAPNSGPNNYVSSMALQPDGRILIGGKFTSFNGVSRYHIARLNTDGSLDTTFNPGLAANGMVWSIFCQTNGQIVIGGAFTSYNGTNVDEVARLNADGSLDTSFAPGSLDGIVNAVAVDSIGRVVIGGDFNNVASVNSGGIARLNVDGSLDTTFNPGVGTYNQVTGTADTVDAIAIQPDGQILAGGSFSSYQLTAYNGILRLNTDGSVDTSFDPGTGTLNPYTGVADSVDSITLQPDGSILVGGDFQVFNQTARAGITRLFSYGSVDTSFMDTAYNEYAGVPNPYFNEDAVNSSLYPSANTRNFVDAIALEASGNVIIGGVFSRVGGGFTTEDIRNRSNVARLVGGATPGPGNIEFAYNSYNADKTAGTKFISLVRTNGSLGLAAVTFGTNTGPAGLGVAGATDFALEPAYTQPTWPTIYSLNAGDSTTVYPGVTGPNFETTPTDLYDSEPYVYLDILNSTNTAGNVSANLTLSDPVGYVDLGGERINLGAALGPNVEAPLTINDTITHPGTLGFSSPTYFVNENGGFATITVSRTGGSDGTVQVSYGTANGTANSTNYTAVSGTLTFKAGVTSQTFTVPITSGTTLAPDKTLTLGLYNATGGAQLGLNVALLTIVNSVFGPGQVDFTQTIYGTNENAGTAYFTVSRLGGSTGQLIVTNSVSAGTAVNGVNFTGSTNVLTWANNDSSSRTIAVPIFDDKVATRNLTVYLSLYGVTVNGKFNANAYGLYTNATLILTNVDSAGSVEFSASTYGVKKYAGYALIPVVRTSGSVQTVTVNYSTVDGTATSGKNYTATSGTLTFTNGQVSQYISVPIIDDGVSDGSLPLAFNLVLSGASPANALGTPSTATVNIIDTESVNETPGSPDVTFSSAAGFNSNVYSVVIETNNQILVGGDFTFANGVPRQHLARLNYNGTLDANFLQPYSTSGANGSVRALATTADGRILAGGLFTTFNNVAMNYLAVLDSDGSLNTTFNPGSGADNPVYAVAETFVNGQSKILAGGAFATINGVTFNGIARLNPDGTPDTTFNPGLGANATVYALAVQSDGKVIIGGDFTAVNGVTNFNHIGRLNADGSVDTSFNPGSGANGSVRSIAIQLDGRILLGGLFTSVNGVALSHIARLNTDGSLDASFQPGLGANDEVFSIGLQTDGRIVLGGSFTTCSGVTRNRVTRLSPTGAVDPTINFGTGANDFVATVAIQEGTIAGYPANVPDEKIIIGGQFTNYDGQAFNHLERIYGGSISGSGAFEFTSANYQVDENGTNVVITVQRTGGTSGTNGDGSGDIYVPFATSDGSAKASINYGAVTGNLDFPEGEVIRTVTIPVYDDGAVTSNLTVNLALSDPFPGGAIGNQPTAILTIINDDSSISFGSATYQVPKNIVSGVAAINVQRQGSAYGTSTVVFNTTTNGTAVVGTDYTPVNETLTFNPGVSNLTATVPINNNGISEGNRTIGLQLSAITGSVPASPTNATLTIIDTVNAPGQFAFASPAYTVTEGGGSGYSAVLLTVVRTNGSTGIASVSYHTVSGTAAAGAKYISTNNVLTFGDGVMSQSFVVQVVNTTTAEGPETFGVVLSNPTGGASLASPATAIVTILNQNTGIAFVSATNAFTEPAGLNPGSVTLNVVRFNNTTGTNIVYYSTTNGTAVAGTNFIGVTNGVLTFYPGDATKSIVISTLYDPLVTGDLFFTVGLSNPSAGVQLTTPSVTTLVDHDVNTALSFLTPADSVFKNQGTKPVYIVCSNTNEEPVSVSYATGGGTAVPNVDYTATSGTVTFTNGISVAEISIPILPNNLVQSNKTFNVTLFNPTGTGVLGLYPTETITIDNTNTPYGLSFSSPVVLNGDWGTATVNNSLGGPEVGDPSIAGNSPTAPVWFVWTAPASGEVTVDTVGSVATNGLKLDTVLGVFTGSSLSTLNQVAANDDMFASGFNLSGNSSGSASSLGTLGQYNEDAQYIFSTNGFSSTNLFGGATAQYVDNIYYQPFGGPSELRFNAKAGVTYYIGADTKLVSYVATPYFSGNQSGFNFFGNSSLLTTVLNARGNIALNWAYHSSGVFRFASERTDMTGLAGTNGNPILLYQAAETESDGDIVQGTVSAAEADTATDGTYYEPNPLGMLVTVTRVAGSAGRVSVDYTTADGNPSMITNGDIPALSNIDYTPISGTLIFDDYEMSKTVLVPIIDEGFDSQNPEPNRDFTVVLSNPQRDPRESGEVSAPRVDSIFGTAVCRILDCNIDPKGPTTSQVTVTNLVAGTTNTIISTNLVLSLIPTNAVFNFFRSEYRIPRDEGPWFGLTNNGIPVTIYVNRSGTNQASQNIYWRLDNEYLANNSIEDADYLFPLQPGSDYAVPTPEDAGAVLGLDSDFAGVGGDSGVLAFPAKNNQLVQVVGAEPKIQFTVNNNYLTEFNRDIHISLYSLDSNGNPQPVGMNDKTTVTVLFNDEVPPAGSVDQLYNPDFAVDLAFPTNVGYLGSSVVNPGTELNSEVYSLIVLPTNSVDAGNQSIIAGAFTTYADGNNTYTVNGIARLNYDGSLDNTFNPGSGVNVFPGGEFIATTALTPNNQILIGGDFSAFNGTQRNSIARLNSDGSLDSTFNPGSGANGTVWAMAQQSDGRIIIAGDFTSYNNNPARYVARLNPDGSFDSTFNAGTNLNGAVYAVALQSNGSIVLGGTFTSAGGLGGQNRIVRLNPDGSLDATFNTITGPNAAVRSLAIQPDGKILAGGEFTLVAGQSEGYVVRFNADGSIDSGFNAGTGTDGTVYSINDNVVTNLDGSTTSSIYLGGAFTVFNGTHRLGFARLYADGTLDTTFLDTAYNQFAGLPRIYYNDPPGTVYASGLQNDGNVMIVGSFQEVGGGQADKNCRNYLETERGLTPSFSDPNLLVSDGGTDIEPKSRDGVRIRGNVARLVGGATPGPGNIGLASASYAVNKSQTSESVTLVRTNGSLGFATANFSVIPGLARSGSDYTYDALAPTYPIEWEYDGPTRDHFDGLFGPNGEMESKYGQLLKAGVNGPSSVNVGIINDTASAGNLNATFQLANPVGADQFYLGGENIPVGVALGESAAPLTLVDNSHLDGVFGFAAPSFTATNAQPIITIVRTNGSSGTVEVSYKTVTAGSTAIPSVDYVLTNGTVTFNPSQTSNTFPVQVLENSYISSTEKTIGLQLFNIQDLSSGNAYFGVTNALIRIINPNYAGFLNLTTNYYGATLSSGSISFTVARTVGSKGSLTVQYATSDGTASNNVDYVGSTNTLSWNSGDVSPRTVSIPLLNNYALGGAKQFSVDILNPTLNSTNWPSLLGSTTHALLNIVNDNNYGVFQFSAPQYQVNENGGFATVTVTRSGSALGTNSINVATADGTAAQSVNYIPYAGTLVFTNGQLSRSFNVTILPNGVDPNPANFYFNVNLSANAMTAAGSLGTPASATINIIDSSIYNQPPGSPDTSFNPDLLINGSVFSLALQANGQIVAGGQFTSVNGASMNHVARLNADGTLDTGFIYGLAGANGSVNSVICQTDQRLLIGGSFTSVNGTVGNRIARLMTNGLLDTSFAPSSGADNSVYALAETFINGSRELYAGGAFSTFSGVSSPGIVRLNNNGSVDAGFSVGSGANGTVYAVAAYPTNSVYDNGDILVGGGFTNFNKIVVGNLVRLTANGSVDTNFAVRLTGANNTVRSIAIQPDGKILIGGDFTAVNGVAVNHLARLNSDGSLDPVFVSNLLTGVAGTVSSIVLQPDNRIIAAGQFIQANGLNRNNITRLNADGSADTTINFGDGANGAVNSVLLQTNGFLVLGGAFTKFEDQPPAYVTRVYGGSESGSGQFSFNSANYQVDEDGGFATITIERNGGSSGPSTNLTGPVFVTFMTSDGTARSGTNYIGTTNVIAFPAGQAFQTVQIPVLDDGVVTPNLTANLALSIPPYSAATLGDQSTALLSIINDDSGVSFATPNYSVPKNTVTGVANIAITRVGGTSGSCTVVFATDTNGTATAGLDYYPTNEVVTFNAGDSVETVQVPIINNTIPEGSRTVGMLLTNATGVVLANPTNAVLTIIDTVNAPGQLFFATNSYTVVKANANAYLTVLRTNGSSGIVSVNYSTVAGTATPGLNYVASSGTLTLGDGVTSGTIAIPLIDNALVQGTVNFGVNLSAPAGGAALIQPTNAIVNILDHNSGVSFQSATNYVIETGGAAVVFVQRIGATNTPFSVSYHSFSLTAQPGTNYTPVSGTLNFASGQVVEAISIPVIDDPLVTGDLLFGVSLTNATAGVQLSYPTNALVVIHDADAGFSFTNNPSITNANISVLKSAGSATITVYCSNPSVEPLIVNSNTIPLEVSYFTTNGTATAGVDYTPVSGTLVFTNGIGTNTFTVPILNNTVLEGNRAFKVVLANPTAPGQLVPPSIETVNIIDISSGVEFSSPTYTVLKTNIAATINVYRTGYTDSIVSVNYSTADGTAVSNVNYTPVSGTLLFTNGVTNLSFAVPIISSTVVQPDLTVLLELSDANNAALTYPSFATLTIEDLSGSYVIPAGAVLVEPEGFSPPNGIIDPGETDTVRFGFRVSSGMSVSNLVATLLPVNGVTAPSNPQTYGQLVVDGPSVSRPFTFTANGTNGQPLVATFKLQNGTNNIGTNTFTFYLGTWTTSYSNTAPIIINDYSAASPYPSVINVSGQPGIIVKSTVTLTNLTHTAPGDIEALVVAPNQQNTLIMANAGAANSVKGVTLTFSDSATNSLPLVITNGLYKPTINPTVHKFP